MERSNESVTGHCWQTEAVVRQSKLFQKIYSGLIFLLVIPLLIDTFMRKEWSVLPLVLLLLATLALPYLIDRFGYDRFATYELSDVSAKINSNVCNKMRREFLWNEVTALQEVPVNFGGFMGSAGIVNYYVLSRGEGNILHVYRPPEEYSSVMCHPDRLSVHKTPETEAIIREQQKRCGFPVING